MTGLTNQRKDISLCLLNKILDNSIYKKINQDVLNNFPGRSDETGKKLLRVVEEIQNFIKDNPNADHKTIKSSVISKVGKLTG